MQTAARHLDLETKMIMLGARSAPVKTIPVVGPNGQFQEVTIEERLVNPGIRLVVVHQGQTLLTAHARAKGYVFYEDMCMGRVDGVKASPGHWELYNRVVEMRGKDSRAERGSLPAEKLYHPHVIELRKTMKSGVRLVPASEVDAMIADAMRTANDIPDVERNRLLDHGRELGMVPKDEAKSFERVVEDANAAH